MSIDEISKITKLDFPPSVKIIGAKYYTGLDDALCFALSIDQKEIENLFPKDKIRIRTTMRFVTNGSIEAREHNWFNPDSIKDFKSFKYSYGDGCIDGLYENSSSNNIIIYLYWFET